MIHNEIYLSNKNFFSLKILEQNDVQFLIIVDVEEYIF